MTYSLKFKIPCDYPLILKEWIDYYNGVIGDKIKLLLVEEYEGQTFVTITMDVFYEYLYIISTMYAYSMKVNGYTMPDIKRFVVHDYPEGGEVAIECQCEDEEDADELPQLVQRFNEVYGTDFWVSHRYDENCVCYAHVSSNHLAPENVFFLGLYVSFNEKGTNQGKVYKPSGG